jgi:Fe-S cluster biogenesis protein NfuA
MRVRLQKLLDEKVNPMVASHGGHIELTDYANRTAFIMMTGGCQGCSSSKATLQQGVQQAIFEAFPRVKRVVDVTDHTEGENPYYS